jgi:hypothetical protein
MAAWVARVVEEAAANAARVVAEAAAAKVEAWAVAVEVVCRHNNTADSGQVQKRHNCD